MHRRKEETNLFVEEIDITEVPFPGVLLIAANSYQAFPCQIEALLKLEKKVNPYIPFSNDDYIRSNKTLYLRIYHGS